LEGIAHGIKDGTADGFLEGIAYGIKDGTVDIVGRDEGIGGRYSFLALFPKYSAMKMLPALFPQTPLGESILVEVAGSPSDPLGYPMPVPAAV
jgi:hypothetical protein